MASDANARAMGEGTTSAGDQDVAAGSAMAALESLAVKGRTPKTGYDREQFGSVWADTGHNGCDTPNDILARDLEAEIFRPATQDRVVLTGILDDPYTATEIRFLRGQDTSTAVQVAVTSIHGELNGLEKIDNLVHWGHDTHTSRHQAPHPL